MQVFYTVLLIIIGVLLFGFVVFFHELGHFLMAKLSGIRVNEFALGMLSLIHISEPTRPY